MTQDRPDKLTPPFRAVQLAEAWCVEDAAGRRFGYCYFDAQPFAGTGRENRLTPDLARRMAVQIARLPALLAEPGNAKRPPA